MSGWEWDELTGVMASLPSLVIIPRSLWTDLAGRLLEEMIISDGLPWMQRFEMISRLLGHPAGRKAAVNVCVSHIADPSNEVFVEPISMLDEQPPGRGPNGAAPVDPSDQRAHPLRRVVGVRPQGAVRPLHRR